MDIQKYSIPNDMAMGLSSTMLKSILDSVPQAIIMVDLNQNIQVFNTKAIEFIDYLTGKYISNNQSIYDYVPETHREGIQGYMQSALHGKRVDREKQLLHFATQATAWYGLSFTPVLDGQEQVTGVCFMAWAIDAFKNNEMILKHQFNFQQLIANLSHRMISIDNIEETFNQTLQEIGLYVGASRTYLFEVTADTKWMNNTFEWCAPGIISEIAHLKNIPTESMPWMMSFVNRGEMLVIDDVAQMPEEATAEKKEFERENIKALIIIPIYMGDNRYGFLGIDHCHQTHCWNEDTNRLLPIVAGIFSTSYERLDLYNHLQHSKQDLETAITNLQETQYQLIQQDQMAGIGNLAAGVAHEINNPLGYILSNHHVLERNVKVLTELMRRYEIAAQNALDTGDLEQLRLNIQEHKRYEKDKKVAYILEDLDELFQDISTGLERVSHIVKGLRAFSHTDPTELIQSYNLNQSIENTLLVSENEYKYVAKIETKLGMIPTLRCNNSQMNQVLLQLLMNSIYAIKIKSKVELGHILIETKEIDQFVELKISDNGCGIDEQHIHKVFHPFFTTKPVGKGTGLGLSLVYDVIVNKYKGTIEVTSQIDKGTTFTIQLPLHDTIE